MNSLRKEKHSPKKSRQESIIARIFEAKVLVLLIQAVWSISENTMHKNAQEAFTQDPTPSLLQIMV